MSDLVALLFGAAIVLLFSYERFNQATYGDGRELERLVDLLTPDKLRARRVVLQAYVFYAAALLMIYFFMCAYAEVLPSIGGPDLGVETLGASRLPALPVEAMPAPQTGFAPRGDGFDIDWNQPLSSDLAPIAPRRTFDIGIDPSVSLAIALVVVGLAPSFPVLRRFEDWMRNAAHQLAGIPTHVIAIRDALRRNYLELTGAAGVPEPDKTLLIPRGDWDRMRRYWPVAQEHLNAPDEFRHDIELIFAMSAWFLERKLKVANPQDRDRLSGLEDLFRRRTEELVRELDEKLLERRRASAAAATPAPAAGEATAGGATPPPREAEKSPDEMTRWSWERLARKADELADDLCILLALYLEHGVFMMPEELPTPDAAAPRPAKAAEAPAQGSTVASQAPGSMDLAGRDPIRQQELVYDRLHHFVRDAHPDRAGGAHQSPSFTTLSWLWTLGAVLAVTLLWSLLPPGRMEAALQRPDATPGNAYSRVFQYSIFAFSGYCIPMIVGLAIRDGARRTHRWRNFWWRHWTVAAPQSLLLVFSAWAAATLFLIGINLWQVGVVFSWDSAEGWSRLRSSFEYNAPYTLRGAVLALLVVLLLDTQTLAARFLRWSRLASLQRALAAAAIMCLVGAVTRYASAWAAAVNAPVPRPGLDSIDRGLIVYGALHSALVGFFVVFCVAEAVDNALRARARPGVRARARGTAADSPEEQVRDRAGRTPVPLLLGVMLAGLATAPGAARAEEPRITIGVRVDARPFIWKERDEANPVGFLWHLCSEGVARAGYDSVQVEIDARSRAAFLRAGTGAFDLLCDPTTITIERLRAFSDQGSAPELSFSPIVFVANGSFVQHVQTSSDMPWRRPLSEAEAREPPSCRDLAQRAPAPRTDTPPGRGWREVLDVTLRRKPGTAASGAPRFSRYELWGYVVGATIGRTVRTSAQAVTRGTLVCSTEMLSHRDAARAFCEGRLARYFGDVELMRAAIDDYLATPGATCSVDYSQTGQGSYEPYAFVMSSRVAAFPERFTLALYSMFADGTVESFFAGSFPDVQKSQYLATLFRINSLPMGSDP